MALIFVASGGSNTAPYETWAKAATSLATALAAATANNGDIVVIQYNAIPAADSAISADVDWALKDRVTLVSASNDGGSAYTPTPMGETYYLGHATGAYTVEFSGAHESKVVGITLRNGGTALDTVGIDMTQGQVLFLEDCTFWLGTTNTAASVLLLAGSGAGEGYCYAKNTTIRLGATSQGLSLGGKFYFDGLAISANGSVPTILIDSEYSTSGAQAQVEITNSDWSTVGPSSSLVGNQAAGHKSIIFYGCKLPSGIPILGTQTGSENESQAEVFVYDCSSGDNHYEFGHYTQRGSTVAVTSPYISDGALYDGTNHVSWKIVTNANVSNMFPYYSPWIEAYNADVSTAITPSLEGLMIDDATVAQNDEIWGEFGYKGTTGTTLVTLVNDGNDPFNGTPADQTSSKTYSDWTASPATDAGDSTFKLTPAASFTPAEIGMLRARVCVGEASKTFYIDPTIRT